MTAYLWSFLTHAAALLVGAAAYYARHRAAFAKLEEAAVDLGLAPELRHIRARSEGR